MIIKITIIWCLWEKKKRNTAEIDIWPSSSLLEVLDSQWFLAQTHANAAVWPGEQLHTQTCKQASNINKVPMATYFLI